jgi:hypothetical protein
VTDQDEIRFLRAVENNDIATAKQYFTTTRFAILGAAYVMANENNYEKLKAQIGDALNARFISRNQPLVK